MQRILIFAPLYKSARQHLAASLQENLDFHVNYFNYSTSVFFFKEYFLFLNIGPVLPRR